MSIRENILLQEKENLSPLAACAVDSLGRERPEAEDPIRTAYMRDRDRVIHSKAFRRLKHKTQVFISPGSDHYRTRLTHTLEVNQIAKTIGRALNLNLDLIEAIALAHDVGHTPFAHCGEEVLNRRIKTGFKHNENSLRVLKRIEAHGDRRGLNLTQEVLDGVLHHSGFSAAGEAMTLEGQIIRFADKIAYVQHDIDDTVRAGLLSEADLPDAYTNVLGHSLSERLTTLVEDLVQEGLHLDFRPDGGLPKLSFSEPVHRALTGLRAFLFKAVYTGDVCQKERERASFVVDFLFSYYMKHPEKMPTFYQQLAALDGREQGVADYISGMTDNFCIALFKDLTLPRSFIGL